MPAESIHEQIAAAIQTLLAAIDGADYWYSLADANKARVVRSTFFDDEDLDEGLDHILVIRPGDETHREWESGDNTDGGNLRAEMEVFVLVARRFTPGTENPFQEEAPTRWTVVNRAVRDVLRKLFKDGVTVSGKAINVSREDLRVDRARFVPGWALAELYFTVEYTWKASTP